MNGIDVCLAGFRDGKCLAVTRSLSLNERTRTQWAERKLEATVCSWDLALKAAPTPGFRKSIRLLRKSIIMNGR